MMIEDDEEERQIARPESLVEVECAGYVAWQDMKECAPITMLDMEVFLASLKESRRWDESVSTSCDVKEKIMNSPNKKIMWSGREIQGYGPYIVPVAVDRVWIHQLSVATLPGDLVQQIVVGVNVLSVGRCEKPLKMVGKILLNKHSIVDAVVVWNG